MTEYTTSSEALREYMTARERTMQWVQTHSPGEAVFVSPSAPPSALSDSDAPSYGPSDSDEESSHSVPPRMVLRYTDGRPDIPIGPEPIAPNGRPHRPRMDAPPVSGIPQHHHSSHIRSRSGSELRNASMSHRESQVPSRHAQSLSYATSHRTVLPRASVTPPRSPEDIVVLPSREGDEMPHSSVPTARNPSQQSQQSHPSHSGTRSHSRSLSSQGAGLPLVEQAVHPSISQVGNIPHVPSSHHSQPNIAAPTPRHIFDPAQIPVPASSPPITYSQSQPLPHSAVPIHGFDTRAPSTRIQSGLPYTYSPPAIVYAPSSRHSKSRYTPPAIVYSPSHTHHPNSRHAAPSIAYSQSAPLPQPTYRSNAGSGTYRSAHGPPILEEPAEIEYDSRRDRSRSRSRPGSAARRTPAQNAVYVDHPRPPPSRASSPADSFAASEHGSRTSGSTYYVLPTPGQKVKLIVPNSASIYTATSTTKSGRSPQSAHSGSRKPFFQRIFHMPKLSGSGSSNDSRSGGPGKRLHRRHTIGGAHVQGRLGVPQR